MNIANFHFNSNRRGVIPSLFSLFKYMAELWKTQFQSNLGSLPRQGKGWLGNDSLSCGGRLASLLGRFTTCGVSPSPFSHGSLTVSPPPYPYFDERTLRCEKISSTFFCMKSSMIQDISSFQLLRWWFRISMFPLVLQTQGGPGNCESSKMLRIFFVRCLFKKLIQSPMGG